MTLKKSLPCPELHAISGGRRIKHTESEITKTSLTLIATHQMASSREDLRV